MVRSFSSVKATIFTDEIIRIGGPALNLNYTDSSTGGDSSSKPFSHASHFSSSALWILQLPMPFNIFPKLALRSC